jgi:hypothetical protein
MVGLFNNGRESAKGTAGGVSGKRGFLISQEKKTYTYHPYFVCLQVSLILTMFIFPWFLCPTTSIENRKKRKNRNYMAVGCIAH